MKKLTVKDLLDNKGKKQLTEVYAHNSNEAAACELAGIDMLVTSENNNVTEIRNAAPNTFLTVGLAYGEHINETRILDASFHAIKLGADAIINVRFTTSMVMQGASEMLAYCTAVKLR